MWQQDEADSKETYAQAFHIDFSRAKKLGDQSRIGTDVSPWSVLEQRIVSSISQIPRIVLRGRGPLNPLRNRLGMRQQKNSDKVRESSTSIQLGRALD
jgi:hypothetical protein